MPLERAWSPFDDPGFSHAIMAATSDQGGIEHIRTRLSEANGREVLWKELALNPLSGPDHDLAPLDEKAIDGLLLNCKNICLAEAAPGYCDQNGWSPWHEILFPAALVRANHALRTDEVRHFLHEKGGFANLWQEMNLPSQTAPDADTSALSGEQIDNMLERAWDICGQWTPYADQYGWSPFNESQFPSAFLSSLGVTCSNTPRQRLLAVGGFAALWRILSLPKSTGPQPNTRGLSEEEVEKVVHQARKMCRYKLFKNPTFPRRGLPTMSAMYSPYQSSNQNYFAPLASTANAASPAAGRRQDQYSGEVSSIDETFVTTQENKSDHQVETPRGIYEDSIAGDYPASSIADPADEDDKENQPPSMASKPTPTTPRPSRVPTAEDLTPKQGDHALTRCKLPIRSKPSPRRLLASEDSGVSRVTSFGYSEDEHYARNIV